MHKLLPFRQYNEKDVVNLFKLGLASGTSYQELVPGGSLSGSKSFYSGTLVHPDSGNDWTAADPGGLHGTTTNGNAYLGAIGSDDQGQSTQWGSIYPEAPMSVSPTAGTDNEKVFGMTLKPTLAYDENGEKLLYYSVKKDELQCSIPGETVPVVTKGFFTFNADSGLANGDAPGHILTVGTSNGTFNAGATTRAGGMQTVVGRILAAGDRNGDGTDDTWFVQLNVVGV